jgi:periplasmic protein TonB
MTDRTGPSYPLLVQRHSVDIFALAIAISLLLHIAASTLLFLPGRFSGPVSAPVFIDLDNIAPLPNPVENTVPDATHEDEPAAQDQQQLTEPPSEAAQLDKAIENSLRKGAEIPDAVHDSSIGLGMVSGRFASFADGESLKDDIRVYYFSLMRRINEVWWLSGAPKGAFTSAASVNIHISREGKVLRCEFLESSGNREQDQAILDSIKKAEPLPPLPSTYYGWVFNAPIRFVPPLRLMFSGYPQKALSPHGGFPLNR